MSNLFLNISMKKMVQKDNYCVHTEYNISYCILENIQALFFRLKFIHPRDPSHASPLYIILSKHPIVRRPY